MDTMLEIALVIVDTTVVVEVDQAAEVEVEEEVHLQDDITEEKEVKTQEKEKAKDIEKTLQVDQVHHQLMIEEREDIESEVNQVVVHLPIQVKRAVREVITGRNLIIKRRVYQGMKRTINKLK